MAWTIPDKGEGDNDIQSRVFQEYLDVLVAGISKLDYVVSGCAVTGGADMTPAVASGVVRSNGTSFVVTGADVTISTADATNPRLDLVVVDSAGALAVRTGTAAAAPKPAARSANDVVLAVVYVPAGDTAIASTQITDMRIIDAEVTRTAVTAAQADIDDHQADETLHLRSHDASLAPTGAVFSAIHCTQTTYSTEGGGNTISSASALASVPYIFNAAYSSANLVSSTICGQGSTLGPWWLGNANNLGGFRIELRFGVLAVTATSHGFWGLKGAWAHYTSGSTLANLVNEIGVGFGPGDANFSRVNNGASGTATPVSLGASFPVTAGALYKLIIRCAPYSGGANPTVYCSLTNVGTGATVSWTLTPGISAMPANTVFLNVITAICNGSGGGVANKADAGGKFWIGSQR